LNDFAVGHGHQLAFREQHHLTRPRFAVGKDFDAPAPGRMLAVVDLAQIQNLPLHHPVPTHPAVLHDAPVFVGLAVLAASLAAKKHDSQTRRSKPPDQPGRSALHANFARSESQSPANPRLLRVAAARLFWNSLRNA
jgi:hypothetical protein